MRLVLLPTGMAMPVARKTQRTAVTRMFADWKSLGTVLRRRTVGVAVVLMTYDHLERCKNAIHVSSLKIACLRLACGRSCVILYRRVILQTW
jgi:hypothetical protein